MEAFAALGGDAVEVAPRLLGCILRRTLDDGTKLAGRIVETEAYHQSDAASHSYKGKTARTEVMFGKAGFAYVYFTYGMHYCVNVVTGAEGEGSAVLIRALEPIDGLEVMRRHRGAVSSQQVTNGPAKVCQALAIDMRLNGHNLREAPLQLLMQPPLSAQDIVTTTRIGISRDTHRPWRFYERDNFFVSKQ